MHPYHYCLYGERGWESFHHLGKPSTSWFNSSHWPVVSSSVFQQSRYSWIIIPPWSPFLVLLSFSDITQRATQSRMSARCIHTAASPTTAWPRARSKLCFLLRHFSLSS